MWTEYEYEQAMLFVRTAAGKDGYGRLLQNLNLDVIVGPQDSQLGTIAAAAGYPSASVPLGYATTYNGRAYGLSVIARAGDDDKVIKFMSAWEASQPNLRVPPPQLVES